MFEQKRWISVIGSAVAAAAATAGFSPTLRVATFGVAASVAAGCAPSSNIAAKAQTPATAFRELGLFEDAGKVVISRTY
jgi:hypothetical protein